MIKQKPLLISEDKKKKVTSGRGPITEIIILIMEALIVIVQSFFELLLFIWKTIFRLY